MLLAMCCAALVAALLCTTSCASVIARDLSPKEHHGRRVCTLAGPSDIAHAYNKYFGTATSYLHWDDPSYCNILDNQDIFDSLTPSFGMKWVDTEPAQGKFDFSGGDKLVQRAQAEGRLLRCHTLIWPYQALPDWLTSRQWSRDELINMIQNHVTTVVTHFKGKCTSWDVVNEAIDNDNKLRKSIFLDVIGPDYIAIAFKAAAAADPNAKLYYNDYNIDNDWTVAPNTLSGTGNPPSARQVGYGKAVASPIALNCGPGTKTKIDAAKCLIQRVREAGGKVDGIGLQAHYTYNSTPTVMTLSNIMSGFADSDLDVAVTELDIRMDMSNVNDPINQRLQAEGYKAVMAACKNTPRCVGVTLWDFTDKYSWIPLSIPTMGSALPWDSNMVRKQMIWDAIMDGWKDPNC